MDRYLQKMKLVPIVNGYPSQKSDTLFTYCYGDFVKQDFGKCAVLLEFDKKNPSQGIYFGCQLEDNTDNPTIINKWESVTNIIKRDLTLFWRSATTVNNRVLEWDFKDKKYHRYWPFWIRLEDNEDIFEAIKCIEFIISSLKAQGFK